VKISLIGSRCYELQSKLCFATQKQFIKPHLDLGFAHVNQHLLFWVDYVTEDYVIILTQGCRRSGREGGGRNGVEVKGDL